MKWTRSEMKEDVHKGHIDEYEETVNEINVDTSKEVGT